MPASAIFHVMWQADSCKEEKSGLQNGDNKG